MLEQIAAQESVADEAPPAAPPKSEHEASALAAKVRAEEARGRHAEQMAASNLRLAAAARQTERQARQNLLGIEESLRPDSPPADGLRLELARLRLGVEEAGLFQLLWNTYGLELEKKQAMARAAAFSAAISASPYAKLLSADRARERLKAIEEELPAIEKESREAAAQEEKLAAEIADLQRRVDAAKGQKSGAAELRQTLLTRLETGRRQESLRRSYAYLTELVAMEQSLVRAALGAAEDGGLDSLYAARQAAESQRAELGPARERLEGRMAEAESTEKALQAELDSPGLSAARRVELEKLLETTKREIKLLETQEERGAAIADLQDRLIAEIDGEIRGRDLSARAIHKGRDVLGQAAGMWNFPIVEFGGSVLTPGKIIGALAGLGVALFLAGAFSRRVAASLVHRFRLPASQGHVVRTLLFYLLSAVLVVTTLQLLHIPLTVFAFLGGALMVGIGFGSQNLMNNFISGLILMLEQKVNVGDMVEADGHFGRITQLGSRCCSILRPDGVEILVPNSLMLEKNVANWTLSDPNHRFDFAVGVAYGSPVERVIGLLERATKEHPDVLSDPAPLVVFENFGDSSLVFRVYFWLRIGHADGRVAGSQIRTAIDPLFRENGIQMPFPQRDVHLKVSGDNPLNALGAGGRAGGKA